MARKTPIWLNVLLIGGILASGGWLGVNLNTLHHTDNAVAEAKNKATNATVNYESLVSQGHQIKYVISPDGAMSKSGLTTIQTADDVFTKLTTYTSGAQYAKNLQYAKKYVTDQSFFSKSGYARPQIDSSGDSILDALDLKSKTQNVSAYQINDEQYLVLVNHAMYHNASDIKHLDSLKSVTDAFILSGNGNQLNQIHQIQGLTATTGIND